MNAMDGTVLSDYQNTLGSQISDALEDSIKFILFTKLNAIFFLGVQAWILQ